MIAEDKIARLWGYLQDHFKVSVNSIGTGLDENKQPCAAVIIDKNTAPDIKTLPDTFEGENVRYRLASGPSSPL